MLTDMMHVILYVSFAVLCRAHDRHLTIPIIIFANVHAAVLQGSRQGSRTLLINDLRYLFYLYPSDSEL